MKANPTPKQLVADRIIRCSDLQPPATTSTHNERRIDPLLSPEAPVLCGIHKAHRLQPGLSIHCADVRDLCDLTVYDVLQPSLRIVIVLDGDVDVSFGPHRLGLSSARGGAYRSPGPRAAFIGLREQECFVRRGWCGKRERKVSVVFSREWLDTACGDENQDTLHRLFDRHLAIEHLAPNPRVLGLAGQLLCPPEYSRLLQKLYLESRTIELVAESIHQLLEVAPNAAILHTRQHRRIDEVRELLDSGTADKLSLAEIARHIGTNISSLQQQFRTAQGMTVFEYLRLARLLRARRALEREGCSIVEAASIAGYNSQSNFATAFRRQFGITPRQSRTGL